MTRRRCALALFTAVFTVTAPVRSYSQQRTESLLLAVVIPVTSSPLFTANGEPARDAERWLASITNALRELQGPELTDIPFSLAPSPVFCDEVQRFGGDAALAVRTELRKLAVRVPLLATPYAEIRLPDLDSDDAITRELTEGRNRIGSCAGVAPTSILAPPDLSVDARVVRRAHDGGVTALLAPAARVRRGPTRSRDMIFVPADAIAAGEAPNDAFVRFRSWEAAAAVVSLERPDLVTFMSGVANDPRIGLRGLSDLVADPAARFVALPPIDDPPRSYRRAIGKAEGALQRIRSYTLPNDRFVGILSAALARARSSAEWDGRWSVGRSRAGTIVRTVDRHERLVGGSEGSVTFTSQRGSVPVTVRNGTSYAVRVRIELTSTKLRFPGGSVRISTVDPPGDTIVFAALARSTGAFPVQVNVTSPNGAVRFPSAEVTVRSTAANIPALALTAGGALFLMAWYARHLARRRRERGAHG